LPESLRVPPDPTTDPAPAAEPAFSFEAFILRRLEEGSTAVSAEAHQQLDRLLLRLALRHTRGNQAQAARVLGISRQTVRAKTREHGLDVTASAEGDEDDED
jgi:two-component system nitrogen regulation response regulator GlnG